MDSHVMNSISKIAELLGEDNEKRLKEGITDLLIERVEKDIDEYTRGYYILDYESLFEEIRAEVEKEIKEKYMKILIEKAQTKMDAMF